jgi:transcriptional regulator with XRE-family HTH domain
MFGEKLKVLREERGLSQQQLADAAGISVWAIRDYEQGKRRFDPGLNLVTKLSRAMKVSMDVFGDCVEVAEKPAAPKPTKPQPKKSKK